MSRVSIYLNFPRTTEEAFTFYKAAFGTEFVDDMQRYAEVPPQDGEPPLADEDKNLVIHVALPILGGTVLMGTDVTEARGTVTTGNNMHINLEPDTLAETERLFGALSDGGTIEMPLQKMFWGATFGSCTDKFGVNWMFNCAE